MSTNQDPTKVETIITTIYNKYEHEPRPASPTTIKLKENPFLTALLNRRGKQIIWDKCILDKCSPEQERKTDYLG